MFRYIIKRLVLAVLTLFCILLMSYTLARLAPGRPDKSGMFETDAASNLSSDREELSANRSITEKLHLDKSPLTGYILWMKNIIFHGDFGESVAVDKGRPVLDLIASRLPVTLKLNIAAIIIIYLLSIPIGIKSAVTPDSKTDKLTTFFLFFLYSLPSFWLALVLQASICEGGLFPFFPLKGLAPASSWGKSSWEILWSTLKHYTLPVFCLSYAGFAGLSRYARAGMLEVIQMDYIRTARAKGLPESAVIMKHAFRNSLIILITLFAGLLPGLVSGSIFIEYVFNIHGMGSLSIQALNSRDYHLLMAIFGMGGALTLAGILLADFMYAVVDPRISFEQKN